MQPTSIPAEGGKNWRSTKHPKQNKQKQETVHLYLQKRYRPDIHIINSPNTYQSVTFCPFSDYQFLIVFFWHKYRWIL